jgi:hypothetical protein
MPKNRGRRAVARRRSIPIGVLAALAALTPAVTITQLGLWPPSEPDEDLAGR